VRALVADAFTRAIALPEATSTRDDGRVQTAVADGDFRLPVCWCCGQPPTDGAVRLGEHNEVIVCYACVDWLNTKRRVQVDLLRRKYGRQPWWRFGRRHRG